LKKCGFFLQTAGVSQHKPGVLGKAQGVTITNGINDLESRADFGFDVE